MAVKVLCVKRQLPELEIEDLAKFKQGNFDGQVLERDRQNAKMPARTGWQGSKKSCRNEPFGGGTLLRQEEAKTEERNKQR